MKRYRRRLLVIEAVLVVLFVCFFTSSYPYISNIFEGATVFDSEYYSKNVNTVEVGEAFEIHRRDAVNIPDFALKGSSHWQRGKYEFVVPFTDAKELGITYTNMTTGTGAEETKDETSAVLYLAKVGTKDTLILAYPHQDLTKMSEVSGIFTSIPFIVKHDVAKNENFSPDDEICEYMLDTRGLEMESEYFDLVFSILMFLMVVFLGIKVGVHYKNHCLTPTYRQLEKYGVPEEVAEDVSRQAEGKKWQRGECVTEDWIVTKSYFMFKIARNHRKHGQFEYVKK